MLSHPPRARPPLVGCSGMLGRIRTRKLVGLGGSNVREGSLVTGAESAKVLSCLGQAEFTVGTPANEIGVVVILTVILPEAHLADLESTAMGQRLGVAARTTQG